jgi:hypothetical protein
MSDSKQAAHYAAALFSIYDASIQLAPLIVPVARNDRDAIDLATRQAASWLRGNGIDRAILDVVKDGVRIKTIPMEFFRRSPRMP